MSPPPAVRRLAAPRFGLGTVLAAAGVGVAAAALAGGVAARSSRRGRTPARRDDGEAARAARKVRDGAAILGTSVLLDSAMEHFRGGYRNRAMYVAPLTAAVSIAAALAEPQSDDGAGAAVARVGHGLSLAVGMTGLAFHVYNVGKRPGGLSWNNVFYAAPLGAPGALVLAGLLGLAADVLAARGGRRRQSAKRPTLSRGEEARVLAGVTGAALLAETGEVWLLHFRGAFHNPAMYLPVTVPPTAALLLFVQAASPDTCNSKFARQALNVTAALGFAGTAFHIYGVQRNMGGWANWRQNALAGPPTPAPISFTGLALAGLAALDLIDAARSGAAPRDPVRRSAP